MIRIDDNLINQLIREARTSSRLRKTYNFHKSHDDLLQRMLNAMEPGTYVRPHMHENPDKREVFIALRGTLCVVQFNDAGEVTEHAILKPGTACQAVEIAQGTWHTILPLETGSVAYEAKDGPYDPVSDKNFAPWAPEEGSAGADNYLSSLMQKLNLTVR